MSINWNTEIVRLMFWKILCAAHDTQELPFNVPRPDATPQQISAAQTATGIKFSDEFIEFLKHANGWKNFFGRTDLFGVADFLSGRANAVLERPVLKKFLWSTGIDPNEAVVIGASNVQPTVFFHFSPRSEILPGGVLWFGSKAHEVDRFSSFSLFFDTMILDEEEEALELAKENGWSESEAKSQGELIFREFLSTGRTGTVLPKKAWEALEKSRK